MSGVNPKGCQVYSFKSPLSRTSITIILALHEMPTECGTSAFSTELLRGNAGSRVHPEFLAKQRIPATWYEAHLEERFGTFASFERYSPVTNHRY